ncbi:MAG TPA: sigma 54-interacting transcriptional regulator, partial [Thermoanaerobaculia bacterium]|nr:sigma 54-interacting transcriptional regulator [Thermoanaerobaculia bacterium]
EQRVLRLAAIREFPYADGDFELPWSFSTRNRLGHWHSIGPRPVHEPLPDTMQCSERELLFFDGSSRWSTEGREAVAAVFRVRAENQRLKRILDQEEQVAPRKAGTVEGIVGDSAAMREIYALLPRIARRDVPVCILGESGTGKELIARAIHRHSPRKQKTFTAVNCAALPENLIESELFGHVRGAFTGADRDRAGLIETTDGGTLFLDEIGELPLPAQAKLLRFLQEGEFRRVGDTVNRTADVRIVSATNRKLESAVEEGRFRDDLYYRIRGVEVILPPLRERAGDILLLASHFLDAEHERHRSGPTQLAPDVEAIFTAYTWPGNVRELQNTLRAAHAMAADAKTIDVEHLPERLRNVAPSKAIAGSYQDAVARFRRDLIERSLLQVNGNQNRAAAMLKISRQALNYQIKELGILIGRKKPQRLRR